MIRRNEPKSEQILTAAEARDSLKAKGYSYRRAAAALGYSESHFFKVLCGYNHSETLFRRLATLPPSPVPRKLCGYAVTTPKGAQ